MVSHEDEFRAYLLGLESAERYVVFLRQIADKTGTDITPRSLATEQQVEEFAAKLAPLYSEKSVKNYRSVMRKYVAMVMDRRPKSNGVRSNDR